MDEDMYAVVRERYGFKYKITSAVNAKNIYADLEIFSEPLPKDEAEAIAKLMNAAREE